MLCIGVVFILKRGKCTEEAPLLLHVQREDWTGKNLGKRAQAMRLGRNQSKLIVLVQDAT